MTDLQIIRQALEGCQDFIANMESTGFGGLALFEYINEALDSIDLIEKQEPVAFLVDGNVEQGLFFDQAAAEVMADANCGTVVPLARIGTTPAGPAVPEGWKLVPVEPTEEMKQAGFNVPEAYRYNASYRAMVAAAPKPETTK